MSAPVPAHLVLGDTAAARRALLEAVLSERPASGRWGVLLTDAEAPAGIVPSPAIAVRESGLGCVCCTGAVVLRVELHRLLREAQPARLLVEGGSLQHARRTVRLFGDAWLAQSVVLAGVALVVDTAAFARDADRATERIAEAAGAADLLVLEDASDEARASARARLAALRRPGARVLGLREAAAWIARAGDGDPTSPLT